MIHDILRHQVINGMLFPTRADYLEYFRVVTPEVGTLLDIEPAIVVIIQRDWHIRGQNGCVFSMNAARRFDQSQWSSTVCSELPDSDTMRATIKAAVADKDNQLHSFIFPNITSSEGVYELVQRSVEAGCILRQDNRDGVHITRLRWAIGDVESWVLGFAPIGAVPVTRQAPFTELVFRTKTKTKVIHPDLNNDPSQAHVADVDLGFDMVALGKLMKKSLERTAKLLGGVAIRTETHGAKAKTTYGIKTNEAREE